MLMLMSEVRSHLLEGEKHSEAVAMGGPGEPLPRAKRLAFEVL